MKASEAYRMMAQVAEQSGNEVLTLNLTASLIAHLAIDMNFNRSQILEMLGDAYDALEPGFQASRAAIAKMQPDDIHDISKIMEVSNEGLRAILEKSFEGKPS